ncbi:hypothetical protein DEO72_LG1g3191 [Vigna unguiculata]|uniref:Uncharacterized protein n=1 Tax=Vigna unguiculata TaxID=3917 RepID=A0A4D6KW50_VIGUN|nr:hypothetical protein DEO72_LG1g3191 [Vigna unguiculata]
MSLFSLPASYPSTVDGSLVRCRRWVVAVAGSLSPLVRCSCWFAAPPFPRRWVVAAAGSLLPLGRCRRRRWFAAPPFPRRWVVAAAGSLPPLGRCRRWFAAAAGSLHLHFLHLHFLIP